MLKFLVRSRHPWLMGAAAGAAVPFALSLAGAAPFAGSPNAWASAGPSPTTSAQEQRVRELEERVKILELENETLDRRLRLDIERNGRSFEEIDRRLRLLEDRSGSPSEPVASPQADKVALEAMCRDPFIEAAHGIRRLKPGCESIGNECDAPEAVDVRGVRRVLPACVQAAEREHGICDPPYFFDKGVKRVKPECM
jgi:hypothetical protein